MCPGTNRTLRMWHVLGYIVVRFAPPLPVARQVKFNCLSQSGRTIVTGGAVPHVYSILLLCSVQPYPHRKQVVNIGSSRSECRASHSGHTLSLYMSLFIFLDVYGFWKIQTGPLELKSINSVLLSSAIVGTHRYWLKFHSFLRSRIHRVRGRQI